jgi:Rad3-related DNA helicase
MAPKKVIKTVIKSKTGEKTLHTDKPIYESVFDTACTIHASVTCNFALNLENLPRSELQALKDYLVHDKSNKATKYLKLVEFCPSFKMMEAVQSKVAVAMETMRKMIIDDLETNHSNEEGIIDMDKVKDIVTSRIAVVDALGMND